MNIPCAVGSAMYDHRPAIGAALILDHDPDSTENGVSPGRTSSMKKRSRQRRPPKAPPHAGCAWPKRPVTVIHPGALTFVPGANENGSVPLPGSAKPERNPCGIGPCRSPWVDASNQTSSSVSCRSKHIARANGGRYSSWERDLGGPGQRSSVLLVLASITAAGTVTRDASSECERGGPSMRYVATP